MEGKSGRVFGGGWGTSGVKGIEGRGKEMVVGNLGRRKGECLWVQWRGNGLSREGEWKAVLSRGKEGIGGGSWLPLLPGLPPIVSSGDLTARNGVITLLPGP